MSAPPLPHRHEVAVTDGTAVAPDKRRVWPQTTAMGVRHVVALFGAAVLAPILMGSTRISRC